jgi:Raf kinase inhibitor-like YbhB/YbcL family protein
MKTTTILISAAVLSVILSRSVPGEERSMSDFSISSAAFSQNGMIPPKYTCDGANVNPPLSFANVPEKTRSLALIVDDPDAPSGTWVHWVVWNIAAGAREIPENSVPQGAVQGTTDFREQKYGGPCPPSGTHRYFFKLYALDAPLSLKAGATKAQVEQAMKGHILSQAERIGLYRRK